MNDHSESSLSSSLKTAVFFLTVLTIILLIGLFIFFGSLSVMFQSGGDETAVQTDPVETVAIEPATPVVEENIASNDPFVSNEQVDEETAVATLPAPATPVIESQPELNAPFGELIIPEIGIDQSVVPIFVRDGLWDISEIGNQIGHLETTGRHPGDHLAMTFTGHVTLPWPEISGPFAELLFLEHGEEITYRWNGVDYIYQVERIFKADPTAVHLLYEEDGDKLILVTCSGWDANGREYAERLVTRAILVREEPVDINSE